LLADAIVEVTETGSSLRANGLRIVETVLESNTKFIVHPGSWENAGSVKNRDPHHALARASRLAGKSD